MLRRFLSSVPLFLLMVVLTLPVLAVMLSWFELDTQSLPILREMLQTVLPEYAFTSVLLCLSVAGGVALIGMGTACAVTLFEFPGRRFFAWALLLPLAMPAYVVAYAYTDFLQYAGPLQSWLRASFGWQGRLLPEIRSLGGAVLVFTVTLYPYVYLLARTALSERAVHLMEAARLLGAPLQALIATGLAIAGDTHAHNLRRTAQARQQAQALFAAHDVLLAPSSIGEAPAGLDGTGDPLFCRSWTLLGLPCVHLPFARGRTGLPVGLQLVGAYGDDHRLLAAAHWVHARLSR